MIGINNFVIPDKEIQSSPWMQILSGLCKLFGEK